MRTRGPFFGLEEKRDETMLGPEYATAMNNVLLHRGRIEPRPGFKRIRSLENSNEVVKQMRVVSSAQPNIDPEVVSGTPSRPIVVAITSDGIGFHRQGDSLYNEASGVGIQSDNVNSSRGTITVFRDQIYFILERQGGSFASKIPTHEDGMFLRRLGLKPPTGADIIQGQLPGNDFPEDLTMPSGPDWRSGFPKGQYQFRVTFYDKVNNVESNAIDVGVTDDSLGVDVSDGVVNVSVLLRLIMFLRDPQHAAGNAGLYARIYARIIQLASDHSNPDLAHGGSVTFLLVEELELKHSGQVVSNGSGEDGGWNLYLDRRSLQIGEPYGSDPALSIKGDGPFSPTRNGVPPASNTAVVFSDSMVYASILVGSYGSILFSEEAHPEHVSPIDVINFDDAGREKTTALFVYQGRLIVFKQNSIYIVAGVLTRKSNANVALGQFAPAPQYQKFRTESEVGCYNLLGGVGVIECDGQLFFNSRRGVYRFDGMRSRKVSDAIDATFQDIPDYYRQQCTMANDDRNGLLWICYASPQESEFRGPATVLCYDYRRGDPNTGVGTWTVHTVAAGIHCVATATAGEGGGTDRPAEDSVAFDPKTLILGGVVSSFPGDIELHSIAGLLDGELEDLGAAVPWAFTVAPQDLRLPDRAKHWHYVTVDHERQQGRIAATSIVETPSGTMSRESDFDANLSHTSKQRVSLRGERLTLTLSGIQSSEDGSQIINGFSIDAEPIGRR